MYTTHYIPRLQCHVFHLHFVEEQTFDNIAKLGANEAQLGIKDGSMSARLQCVVAQETEKIFRYTAGDYIRRAHPEPDTNEMAEVKKKLWKEIIAIMMEPGPG